MVRMWLTYFKKWRLSATILKTDANSVAIIYCEKLVILSDGSME